MVLFVRDAGPLARVDPAARVVRAADYAVCVEVAAVLEGARAEAADIVAAAQGAYEQACARGYRDGQERARIEAAEKMIENVSHTIDYFAKVEERVVEIVLEAMRRIVADFDDRERVTRVVSAALAAVRNQKHVTARVSPERVAMVKESMDGILAAYPAIGFLEIVGDGRLRDDACIIETEIGIVEASLDGQIAALGRAFGKVLGGRR